VSVNVALLSRDQVEQLPGRAREAIEYRKSGLSLNHIQGCPLDCAYCIRHTYGLWDQRMPKALMTDAQAVEELVSHRYFLPHITPVQVFNRATDPFLPAVRPQTFAVLENLDARGLRNAEADRPDLAVILQADPEIIARRLRERGAHNRFQLAPGSSHAEVHFYRQATDRLIQAGFDVLQVVVNQRPPEQAAMFIRDRLMSFFTVSKD
jgi:hypothetical protein